MKRGQLSTLWINFQRRLGATTSAVDKTGKTGGGGQGRS